MQDDYLRVSERYNQIFRNLDEELEKRIVALDKNVFEISKKVQGEQLHSETLKKVGSIVSDINCNSGQKTFIPVIYKEPY